MLENNHRAPPNSHPSHTSRIGNSSFQARRTTSSIITTKCISQPIIKRLILRYIQYHGILPLFPTQSDFVELAALVPYDTVSGEVEEERDVVVNLAEDGGTQETPAGRPSWTLIWPFSKWYRSKDQPSLGSTDPHRCLINNQRLLKKISIPIHQQPEL